MTSCVVNSSEFIFHRWEFMSWFPFIADFRRAEFDDSFLWQTYEIPGDFAIPDPELSSRFHRSFTMLQIQPALALPLDACFCLLFGGLAPVFCSLKVHQYGRYSDFLHLP